MSEISMLELAGSPPSTQARVLSSFLYHLTMGVRDIYTTPADNMIHRLIGINQINHMIIPFIESIVFGSRTTYTVDVIMQNLVDMAPHYDITNQVAIAWNNARSYARLD